METKVYGASDDLIEVEGPFTEEFGADSDEGQILAFSDGTLLELKYDNDGLWRIVRLAEGTCEYAHVPGSVYEDRCDVAILRGELRWVVKSERGQYSPCFARKR
jgi:hypothetical protein